MPCVPPPAQITSMRLSPGGSLSTGVADKSRTNGLPRRSAPSPLPPVTCAFAPMMSCRRGDYAGAPVGCNPPEPTISLHFRAVGGREPSRDGHIGLLLPTPNVARAIVLGSATRTVSRRGGDRRSQQPTARDGPARARRAARDPKHQVKRETRGRVKGFWVERTTFGLVGYGVWSVLSLPGTDFGHKVPDGGHP
jgi:hypothetical protein